MRRRREFITLLGGAVAAAWPLGANAQRAALPVIGHMHAGAAEGNRDEILAFKEGLKQHGYIDGQNVSIEYRWADGRYDRLPSLAAELIDRHVSLIVAGTPVAALAAKHATASIPIVFHIGSYTVKDGLDASRRRHGSYVYSA